MIIVNDGIKTGDLVYAWYTPYKEKLTSKQKPNEHEYRVELNKPNERLSLYSVNGEYTIIFDKSFLEGWYGGVRKI